MGFDPKVLIIREDLFALAGRDHLECLMLHRMLQKDFVDWNPYSFDQFHRDMMLFDTKSAKVNKCIIRLVDKGYILKQYSLEAKIQKNSYKTQLHKVNSDLQRLGYPIYEEYHACEYNNQGI